MPKPTSLLRAQNWSHAFVRICLLYITVFLTALLPSAVAALDSDAPKLPAKPYDYTSPINFGRTARDFDTTPLDNPTTNEGTTLGRVLFYDSALSKNRLVRCASCHSQANGFDDPNRFSIGFEGKITSRHSMGLANARFNRNNLYFWDERVQTLENQVLQPIFDPIEMGLTAELLVKRVSDQKYYRPLFMAAFGEIDVTEQKIAFALAQFVRSMVSTGSRFDTERNAVNQLTDPFRGFTELENRGKQLFFTSLESGGAGCSQCHQTELFLMTRPLNNGLDGDDVGGPEKFRAASLRNIAVRGPFMHDGRFDTLQQVLDHYSEGIVLNRNLDPRMLSAQGQVRNLVKTEGDKKALIAFLHTLTDQKFLTDQRFSDPFSN